MHSVSWFRPDGEPIPGAMLIERDLARHSLPRMGRPYSQLLKVLASRVLPSRLDDYPPVGMSMQAVLLESNFNLHF